MGLGLAQILTAASEAAPALAWMSSSLLACLGSGSESGFGFGFGLG